MANFEQQLRTQLTGAGSKGFCASVGMDESSKTRVLSGQTGITIDKVDAFIRALGMVVVSTKYLEAIGTLCEVGAHCSCARNGNGECGKV